MAIVKAKKLSREQRQKESQTAFDIDYQTHNLRIKYFNLASSFLPFTHDKVTRDGVEDYRFNQDKTDIFINELMEAVDDLYLSDYRECVSNNPRLASFYRAFFYLVIRLTTLSREDRDETMVTFHEFQRYAEMSVTDLNRAEFENRYAALKDDYSGICTMPGMIGRLNDAMAAVDRDGFFLPNDKGAISKSAIYIDKYAEGYDEEDRDDIIVGHESYISYLKANLEIEDDGFFDQEVLEMAIRDYYYGLFLFGNETFASNVNRAVTLFLVRNNMTITADEDSFDEVFNKVDESIKILRAFNEAERRTK